MRLGGRAAEDNSPLLAWGLSYRRFIRVRLSFLEDKLGPRWPDQG